MCTYTVSIYAGYDSTRKYSYDHVNWQSVELLLI